MIDITRRDDRITTHVIRRPEDLRALKQGWKALSQSARLPTQTYAWVSACAAAFAAPGELHVFVVADRAGPIAVAPLLKRRGKRRGAPARLVLLGVDELSEPMDFVWADERALRALADALVHSRLPLWLQRIPTDSPTVAILEQAYRWRRLQPGEPYPRIPLHPGWAEPESQLSSSRRSLLRRMRRRAERMGAVTFEVLTPRAASLSPLLDQAFHVEAASWKGREGTALEKDRVRGAFFRAYAASACEEGSLRLAFMRIGARNAAMMYAVEHRGGFWILKIGYDDEFASCSPGQLLIEHTVKYAAIHGLASYEFLGSVEDWTRAWTRTEPECLDLRTYPASLNAAMAFASDATRSAAERRAAAAATPQGSTPGEASAPRATRSLAL